MALGLTWLIPLTLWSGVPEPAGTDSVMDSLEPVQRQAGEERVRSRIVIRIVPYSGANAKADPSPRAKVLADEVQRRRPDRNNRRCLALAEIKGVQLGDGGRLLLMMHDRRVYSAALERSCPVHGFYSGFYVDRPDDGMLCAGREALHARSGMDCKLGSFEEVDAAE